MLNAILDSITGALDKDTVTLVGFGTFENATAARVPAKPANRPAGQDQSQQYRSFQARQEPQGQRQYAGRAEQGQQEKVTVH